MQSEQEQRLTVSMNPTPRLHTVTILEGLQA